MNKDRKPYRDYYQMSEWFEPTAQDGVENKSM